MTLIGLLSPTHLSGDVEDDSGVPDKLTGWIFFSHKTSRKFKLVDNGPVDESVELLLVPRM
jgi:hypothetical protein